MRHRYSIIRSLAIAALSACGAAAAQDAPAPAAPPPELTQDSIAARLAAAEASTTLDETAKAKVTELLNAALDELKAAQGWKAKAREFQDLLTNAPASRQEIEEGLKSPPAEPKVELPNDATLAMVNQRLTEAEAALAEAEAANAQLEKEPGIRAERRRVIPGLVQDVARRIEEARTQPAAETDAPPELADARAILAQARLQTLEAERDAYAQELRSYEARGPLLTLRLDRAARRVAEKESMVAAWRKAAAAFREREAQAAAAEAANAMSLAEKVSPGIKDVVKQIAEKNAALVDKRTGPEGLVRKLEKATAEERRLNEDLSKVLEDFQEVQTKAEAVELSDAIGLLLREHRRRLPDVRQNRRDIKKRTRTIQNLQFEELDYVAERRALGDVEAIIAKTMGRTPGEDDNDAKVLRELLTTQRQYLDDLLADYNSYIDTLLRLQLTEQDLVRKTEAFTTFIKERVLWVRSGPPLSISTFGDAFVAAGWLLDPGRWRNMFRCMAADLRTSPLPYVLYVAFFVLAIAARRQALRRLLQAGETAARPACVSFRPTTEAFVITCLAGLVLPAILWFLSMRMEAAPGAGIFEHGLASALVRCALVLATFAVPWYAFRSGGLAETHFGWRTNILRGVRKHLAWLMVVSPLAALMVTVLEWSGDERHSETLGRLIFIAAMAAFVVFAHVLVKPKGGILADTGRADKQGQPRRGTAFLWYGAAVGIPAALGLLACAGYYFTALRLSWRFHGSVSFVVALLLLRSYFVRWLLVIRRRLARENARRRREALKAEHAEDANPEPPPELDLVRVDMQTQKLVRMAVLFSLILGLWFIWFSVLPALSILNRVELWETTVTVTEAVTDADGDTRMATREGIATITLAHLSLAALVVAMTVALVRNLPGFLEIAVLQRLSLAPGERYAVTTVIGYAISIAGGITACQIIGINWSKIQWLIAAMGVGLGFGLQEIFANFISGLILLFERPIRVGDTITVGGVSGTVSRIRIRATRIVDWDRKELVVPNKEFVTGQLINWTLSDSVLRVVVPVGIAYSSDAERAVRTLKRVADDSPRVLDDPPPQVLFLDFGDNALGFELRVFCQNVETYLSLKHELHMRILEAFRQEGIEISFPQRDLHIRSMPDSVKVVLRNEAERREENDS